MEIERKFKLTAFPTDLTLAVELDQYQGYLATDPEVRIRRTENHTEGRKTISSASRAWGIWCATRWRRRSPGLSSRNWRPCWRIRSSINS